jgi:hypothetical protein
MTTPTTTILPPETYGPQTVTSGETLLSQHAQSTTIIQDTGGFYTFGVNDVVSTTTGAQIGDLLGDGFTIDATNPWRRSSSACRIERNPGRKHPVG